MAPFNYFDKERDMKHYFPSDYRVVAKLIGANMNVTTDQALPIQLVDDVVVTDASNFMVHGIVVTNASISLTTAAGGIYTAASKAGSAIVAAAQVYSALTASSKWVALTLAGTALTDVFSDATTLYLSLTTAQGAAATADVYVYGRLFQQN